MLKASTMKPSEKFSTINSKGFGTIVNNVKAKEYLLQFGVSVESSFVEGNDVPARKLRPPTLSCKLCLFPSSLISLDRGRQVPEDTVSRGSWNMNGQQFTSGTQVNRWAVITFQSRDEREDHRKAQEISDKLERIARNCGVQFSQRPEIFVIRPQDIEATLRRLTSAPRVEFCLCLLPRDSRVSDGLYKEIKQLSDKKYGIVTQCAQMAKIQSTKPAYLANLCLKVGHFFHHQRI